MDTLNSSLEDTESQKLIMALAYTRGDKGFSEEEAAKVLHWVEHVRIDNTLVDMVLDGTILVNVENANMDSFEDLTFISTEKQLSDEKLADYHAVRTRIDNGL